MKIPNTKELQEIAINHSSDIDFKYFMKIYKNVQQNHIFVSQRCNFTIRQSFTYFETYFKKNI